MRNEILKKIKYYKTNNQKKKTIKKLIMENMKNKSYKSWKTIWNNILFWL